MMISTSSTRFAASLLLVGFSANAANAGGGEIGPFPMTFKLDGTSEKRYEPVPVLKEAHIMARIPGPGLPHEYFASAIGEAPTSGWSSALLVPIDAQGNKDRLYDFSFVALPPSSNITTPATTSLFAGAPIERVGDIDGIRVWSKDSCIVATWTGAPSVPKKHSECGKIE